MFIDLRLFQIGRSSDPPIDFVVMDTIPGDKQGEERVNQSTISRFACRILADRSNPRVCRIYAAGFDSSRNIFLGVSYSCWYRMTRVNRRAVSSRVIRLRQASRMSVKWNKVSSVSVACPWNRSNSRVMVWILWSLNLCQGDERRRSARVSLETVYKPCWCAPPCDIFRTFETRNKDKGSNGTIAWQDRSGHVWQFLRQAPGFFLKIPIATENFSIFRWSFAISSPLKKFIVCLYNR